MGDDQDCAGAGTDDAATALAAAAAVDALLISPGPDLRYLTGYHAPPFERLTCLVLRTEGHPLVVCPR